MLQTQNGTHVFDLLLSKALEVTQSRLGFIASIHFRPTGAAYLKVLYKQYSIVLHSVLTHTSNTVLLLVLLLWGC